MEATELRISHGTSVGSPNVERKAVYSQARWKGRVETCAWMKKIMYVDRGRILSLIKHIGAQHRQNAEGKRNRWGKGHGNGIRRHQRAAIRERYAPCKGKLYLDAHANGSHVGAVVSHPGFIIDLNKMEVHLPPNKLHRAQISVETLFQRKSVTRSSLEEILGFLSHCCQVTLSVAPPYDHSVPCFSLLSLILRSERSRGCGVPA